jgi:hypothetical protein
VRDMRLRKQRMAQRVTKTPEEKGRVAAAKFFLRIGQVQTAQPREEWSDYLFPLWLLMDSQGELAKDAKHIATAGQRFAAESSESKETK